MQPPVNIERFRTAIGHDAAVEAVLLRLFFETTDGALARLSPHMADDEWQEALHMIKGAALNLGADELVAATIAAKDIVATNVQARETAIACLHRQNEILRQWLTGHSK